MIDDSRPIFAQIAERIAGDILAGSLGEEDQVPSTNELAAFHRINPATAAKGMAQLVADGILHKRRGIGMFVTAGARERLRERRRTGFADQFLDPLVAEARMLGLSAEDLHDLLDRVWKESR